MAGPGRGRRSQAYPGPAPPHRLRAQRWVWNPAHCRRTSSLPGFLREMRCERDERCALGVRQQQCLGSLFTETSCQTLHLSDGRETWLWGPKAAVLRSSRRETLPQPLGSDLGTCSWSKGGPRPPPPPPRALGRHSPMALATSLTRSVISSSPAPASARAPATCTHTEIGPQRERSHCTTRGQKTGWS